MVIATGFFDGVHLGHRKVIDTLVRSARERCTESVIITFWPHPRTVLQNDAGSLRLLSSLEEKKEILLSLGVDRVEVLNFTKEFSCLTAREYLEKYVKGLFSGTALVLGYDNRMGSDAATSGEVEAAALAMGFEVIRAESLDFDGVTVSSTKIRTALSEGRVSDANAMLGGKYGLHGVVMQGNRLGRTIGFPTANMQLYDPLKVIPANGCYLTEVSVLDGLYYGMTNIGVRPTVGRDSRPVIETNIFDFNEDIYGLDIRIRFLERIRDEVRFGSFEELRQQLEKDREVCRILIK